MTDRSASGATNPARSAVFTIVSRNYLHFALNLMASVADHLPGTRRVIVVCDSTDDLPALPPGSAFIGINALGIEHVDRMAYQYSILELNTAIKPFAFAHLFASLDVDNVIYFDPDIQLFSSGSALLQRLQSAQVILTPHLTAPLDDERHPSDLSIVQSGSYNLGFLALRRSAGTQALLAWWQRKLTRDCVVDIPRGLFTDQKWMDLVPGLFDGVHIERHPGWNVAYWNLLHRQVTHEKGDYQVNGEALFFFHFSGYSSGSRSISKHQDRFNLDQCSPAVQALFALYSKRLDEHGRQRFAALPYAFARLADGTPLPDAARQLIRSQIEWSDALPDFGTPPGARFLIDFLTAPVDGRQPALSRLALQIHAARADLQAAFPDLLGAHRQAFVDWFKACAGPEAGVLGALAAGVGEAGVWSNPASANEADSTPTAAQPAGASRRGFAAPYRLAYRLAWAARNVLRPLTTPALRNRVRDHLIRRAYPAAAVAAAPAQGQSSAPAAPATGAPQDQPPFGVTVIGYVAAESGVGESARATLRALACTDVPLAALDFRAGNVSRMAEVIDPALLSGQLHAVSLLHVNADQLPLARTLLGEGVFSVPHRIGFWAWELENFPEQWQGAFNHVDEVWVPSSFCQQAIGAASPVPVLCFPHAVDIPTSLQPDRARFGLASDSVVFLAMADVMSSVERKNPFGAVQAFAAAFADGATRAELVVKISNGAREPAALKRLQDLARTCPGIHLITDVLDRPALNRLLDSVDCVVSLHRSEGFGLVLAEAMARAKVVLATGWSGNMDFMHERNSLPVDFQLTTIQSDCGPYRRGQRWAEPVLADAIHKMRLVVNDAALRGRLGQRAREDCLAQLAPAVVGQRMAARLQALRTRKNL